MLPVTLARLVPSPAPLTYRFPPSCRPTRAPRSTLSSRAWPVAAEQRAPTLSGRSLSPTRSVRSRSAPPPASTAAPLGTGVRSPAVRSVACDGVTHQSITVRFHDTPRPSSTPFSPAATPGVTQHDLASSSVTPGVTQHDLASSSVTPGVTQHDLASSSVTPSVTRHHLASSPVTPPPPPAPSRPSSTRRTPFAILIPHIPPRVHFVPQPLLRDVRSGR